MFCVRTASCLFPSLSRGSMNDLAWSLSRLTLAHIVPHSRVTQRGVSNTRHLFVSHLSVSLSHQHVD